MNSPVLLAIHKLFPLRRTLLLFALASSLWALGFFVFVMHIETLAEPSLTSDLEDTDAIVVLTGGSERLSTGLALLDAHKGKKLFISGVHQGFSIDRVLSAQNINPSLRNCCIILGYSAESTHGNAEETQLWMKLENYHSLRLVTANYHMPRSLLIFHSHMPNLVIIPHPITPDSVRLDMWWQHSGTASLLVTEYVKYILALVRTEMYLP